VSAQLHDVRIERVGDSDVVRVKGEVDLSNASALLDAVTGTASRGVALELGELSYLDSAGIRAIDQGYRTLRAEGRSLVVVVPDDSAAQWIFRVTGLAEHLVAQSLPEALAVLREGRRDAGP
jgi:anti-anti-sigma factor